METKVTTASIKIALSHQYSVFEVAMNLENPEGITVNEIDSARLNCQTLAQRAVDEYKLNPAMNPKAELFKVEKKLEEIKNFVGRKGDPLADAKAEEEIKSLPDYQATKK